MINNEEIMLESLNEQLHYSNVDKYLETFTTVSARLREALTVKQYETMLDDLHKFEVGLSKLDKSIDNREEHESFLKDIQSLKAEVVSFLEKFSKTEYRNAVLAANGQPTEVGDVDTKEEKEGAENNEL